MKITRGKKQRNHRALSLTFAAYAGVRFRSLGRKEREKERERERKSERERASERERERERKSEREREIQQQRWKKKRTGGLSPTSYYDARPLTTFFPSSLSPTFSLFSRPPFSTMLRTFVSEVASRGLRVQAVPALSRGFATSTFFNSSSVVVERRRRIPFFRFRTGRGALSGQSKPFYRLLHVLR